MDHDRSSYLNHTLNKSPSKTTYSFSKSERFPNSQYQIGDIFPKYEHSGNFDSTKHISPKKFRNQSRQEKNKRSKSKRDIRHNQNRSKERSPYKNNTSPQKNSSKSLTKRLKFEQNSSNISNGRSSPIKNHQHLERYQTNGQYYPLGIQINKQGKYVVSNYQNVKTASFGKLPRQYLAKQYESNLGPGSYDIANKSPGKYYTSDNKNNLATSFSKLPRKGPQDINLLKSLGPGMYNTFSQFGNLS